MAFSHFAAYCLGTKIIAPILNVTFPMSYVNKFAIEDWMSVYAASLRREAQVKVSESLLIVVSGKVVHVVPIIAISREYNHDRD